MPSPHREERGLQMEWMFLPYRRYFEFGGRSRRKEYWMFALFMILVALVISVLFGTGTAQRTDGMFAYSRELTPTGNIIQGIFSLASLIPGLAVAVRRLHDTGRSAWWLLLLLVPFVGWIVLIVFYCLEGDRGPNRFGSDPKDTNSADVFA
jgi:uncharacterized membrane protein YhaH (DUF805 family)